MSNFNIQKLMSVTISIDVNGISTERGRSSPYHEGHEETFGVGIDDAEQTASILHEIAEAIEEGRLYGWMAQDAIDSRVKAGELREETPAEQLQRHRDMHSMPLNGSGPPPSSVVTDQEAKRSFVEAKAKVADLKNASKQVDEI